jgi:hypothetical protein
MHTQIWLGNLMGRYSLEDWGHKGIGWEGVDWNIWLLYTWTAYLVGIWLAEQLLASEEGRMQGEGGSYGSAPTYAFWKEKSY